MKTQSSSHQVTAASSQVVNRIPPSSVKPTKREAFSGSKASSPNAKRNKHSFKNARPMDLEPLFQKMDTSDPKCARRVAQRRKAVAKGKNTAGYVEYTRQVPKEKRRIRCTETPSTPDPTVDMSNGRFNGLVRAWRIALHKYDPPELVTSLNMDQGSEAEKEPVQTGATACMCTPVKMRELEVAAEKGLLVDLVPKACDNFPVSPLSASMELDDSAMEVGSDSDHDDLL